MPSSRDEILEVKRRCEAAGLAAHEIMLAEGRIRGLIDAVRGPRAGGGA